MVKVLASIGMLLTYTAAISAANTPRWVGCSKSINFSTRFLHRNTS